MHKQFTLRAKANDDLENIYLYSVKKWGMHRADSYIRDLQKGFEKLANHPTLGMNYAHIKPHLRAYLVASHLVFYKPTNNGVTILRVLHKSMDVKRHL